MEITLKKQHESESQSAFQMRFEPTTLRHLAEESHGFKSHLGLGFLATALSIDHLERIIAVACPSIDP